MPELVNVHVAPPKLQPYWVSECGNYEMWCADCREVLPLLATKSIDAVVTDPPYGISYRSNMRVVSQRFDVLHNAS